MRAPPEARSGLTNAPSPDNPPDEPSLADALGALQRALSQENKCLGILVKVDEGTAPEEVARRIDAELPKNQVILTSDIGMNFGGQIPGIQGFIRAVMGLSMVVSSLVILLAMYTTITERTREIGILKSLGAPKIYIIGVIEKEAVAISAIGVAAASALHSALFHSHLVSRLSTARLSIAQQKLLEQPGASERIGQIDSGLIANQVEQVRQAFHESFVTAFTGTLRLCLIFPIAIAVLVIVLMGKGRKSELRIKN